MSLCRTTGIKSFLKCLQIIEFVSAKMLAQILSAVSFASTVIGDYEGYQKSVLLKGKHKFLNIDFTKSASISLDCKSENLISFGTVILNCICLLAININ